MTRLKKPVARVTEIASSTRCAPRKQDRVIVTLYPGGAEGGTIGLRQLRCKKEYTLTLEQAYMLAVNADICAERRRRKAR